MVQSYIFLIILYLSNIQSLSQFDCRCKLGSIQKKIIGGKYADNFFVPWQSALFYNGIFICGGFILNEFHIATASHCVNHSLDFNLSLMKVVIGSVSLRFVDSKYIFNVSSVYKHPEFNVSHLYRGHDIAFLKLKTKILFEKSKIEPGCITYQNTSQFKELMVSGYGSTSPIFVKNGLRTSLTPSNHLKYAYFKEHKGFYSSTIIQSESVNRNESTCNGDSGSPAMGESNGKTVIVGLNSFGWILINRTNSEEVRCLGQSNFARITYEKSFIDKLFTKKDYCLI